MSLKNLNLAVDGSGIALMTLNRPERHNAFDDLMLKELSDTLDMINHLDDVRVVILKAQGKSFSAGADVAWMQRMKDSDFPQNLADAQLLASVLHKLYKLPKITIALIQGPAYGGGVGLSVACDISIASPSASFCFSEVKIGLIPAVISPYVLRAIGERQTKRYFLTAETITANQALDLGLVHELVEHSLLLERGYGLAQQILGYSPQALQATKRLLQETANLPLSTNLIEKTTEEIATIRVSDEAQEGLQAFLEKRPPKWPKNHI